MDWLKGKQVAVAGKLVSMTKADACELIRRHGGHVVASVNRQTSFLMVGQENWPLQRDGRLPRQIIQAHALQQSGHAISIIAEDEFLNRLGVNGSDDIHRFYTLSQVVDILNIPRNRVRAWLHAGLIQSTKSEYGISYFNFRQVASAKTLCELSNAGISTERMRRNLEQLRTAIPGVDEPLEQLTLLEKNGQLLVRLEEGLIEPSGQMLLDFEEGNAVIPVQPTSAAQWFHIGCQNEQEGFMQEAADAYRQALVFGGPDSDVVFNLANVLYQLGLKEEASERFRQVIEIDPAYAEAWNNLGIVLVDLNRSDEAVAAFKRAIATHYMDAHYNLADLLETLGRKSEALDHWQAYFRYDPEGPHGRYARGKLG